MVRGYSFNKEVPFKKWQGMCLVRAVDQTAFSKPNLTLADQLAKARMLQIRLGK